MNAIVAARVIVLWCGNGVVPEIPTGNDIQISWREEKSCRWFKHSWLYSKEKLAQTDIWVTDSTLSMVDFAIIVIFTNVPVLKCFLFKSAQRKRRFMHLMAWFVYRVFLKPFQEVFRTFWYGWGVCATHFFHWNQITSFFGVISDLHIG